MQILYKHLEINVCQYLFNRLLLSVQQISLNNNKVSMYTRLYIVFINVLIL